MLEFIQRRLAEGALSVTEDEIMNAVVPAEHPSFGLARCIDLGLIAYIGAISSTVLLIRKAQCIGSS